MQIRKWGTLAITLLITAHFLKEKKVDLYVKDSEVKVIVSKAGTTRVKVIVSKARTTRVWLKPEIKHRGSKYQNEYIVKIKCLTRV